MKYYKLGYDYEHDQGYVDCSIENIYGMDRYAVEEGKFITSWDQNINFEYDPQDGNILTDYLSNVLAWFIVSEKFREISEDLISKNVQYLPLKIINHKNKKTINSYMVANIINVLDAFDTSKSIYKIFRYGKDKILTVSKYVLKKEIIQNHHIFLLKDDTIPIFISEELKNRIRENNLLGFRFSEIKTI